MYLYIYIYGIPLRAPLRRRTHLATLYVYRYSYWAPLGRSIAQNMAPRTFPGILSRHDGLPGTSSGPPRSRRDPAGDPRSLTIASRHLHATS